MALNLSHLDGTNGFRLDGAEADDYSGASVSGVGDVNGDGIDDLIIGAPAGYYGGAGAVYVVFGRAAGFPLRLDLGALDGGDGFRITDEDGALGSAVSDAGDINGDGIADLIVGARYAGTSYVVFGNAGGFDAGLDLGSLDGTNGFRLESSRGFGSLGPAVAGAGDVNGDGIDDLIVGAPDAPGDAAPYAAGEAYVILGTSSGFDPSLDVATLDGTNGFRLDGTASNDHAGGLGWVRVVMRGVVWGLGLWWDDRWPGIHRIDWNGVG